ncbi:hypothetical protein VQU99_001257 [Klebsiella pneumoniae]|uniref:hypothetical protein n=1 Tax=Klebsiella pneumoniae TaxID=573 RepID=UPI001D09DC78|nr:hypothetical protein [Klebsiella pneumoniae]EMD1827496.1 hypothetical protein [Klebsiella pneumoniae]UUC09082.1 hypothetical protein [Klebsiella pneumoniae]
MHLENCLEDMNVISNALATMTSNVSRFSNANSTPKAFPKRVHTKFKMRPRIGGITRSTRPGFADSHEFRLPQTEGIPVQESSMVALLAEIERRLEELTTKHVRLTHHISGYSAEQIRDMFGESRYEDLKNIDLTIRGLEGFVNKFIRDVDQPHPYMKRLSDAITEYRLAVSDLLMILNQCFNEVEVIESQTGLIDEHVFENFSFH